MRQSNSLSCSWDLAFDVSYFFYFFSVVFFSHGRELFDTFSLSILALIPLPPVLLSSTHSLCRPKRPPSFKTLPSALSLHSPTRSLWQDPIITPHPPSHRPADPRSGAHLRSSTVLPDLDLCQIGIPPPKRPVTPPVLFILASYSEEAILFSPASKSSLSISAIETAPPVDRARAASPSGTFVTLPELTCYYVALEWLPSTFAQPFAAIRESFENTAQILSVSKVSKKLSWPQVNH